MKLEDKKVILITGGSQGLGKETAKILCKENKVIIFSNDKKSLDETVTELGIDGYLVDISSPDQIEKAVEDILKKFERVDVLINNAGIWLGGELDTNDYTDIAHVVMVNVVGTIFVTRALLPVFKKQSGGKIINIGSTNGIETKAERSVYVASKWAVTGFTGSIRKELEPYNISVVGVNPGLMKTNLHKNAGFSERDYSCAMDPVDVAKVIEIVIKQGNVVVEQITFRGLHCEIY